VNPDNSYAVAVSTGHLRSLVSQVAIHNVLNNFMSVNFVQREKLRCGCRHAMNPYEMKLCGGYLNLAQSAHYNVLSLY
jgi:hypothetical protein